jgi:hypothetical protein
VRSREVMGTAGIQEETGIGVLITAKRHSICITPLISGVFYSFRKMPVYNKNRHLT